MSEKDPTTEGNQSSGSGPVDGKCSKADWKVRTWFGNSWEK